MTNAVATHPRRKFLLDADEQLLITRDALVSAERLTDFVNETGIAPEDIVADPVTALPLPIHARGKRFDSVEPEALWNPLFWLPEDIALRIRIRENDTSEPRPETDPEWAIRVALEIAESGLYTPDEGWLDVFALYGINTDDPIDLEAIQAWQAGLPEERLDAINLRDHVTFTAEHAAFHNAQELYPLLMSAQWAFTASSLLVAVEADPKAVATYAALAAEMLSSEPSDAPDQLQDASDQIAAGGSLADLGPKVVAALNEILAKYADAIYELEKL